MRELELVQPITLPNSLGTEKWTVAHTIDVCESNIYYSLLHIPTPINPIQPRKFHDSLKESYDLIGNNDRVHGSDRSSRTSNNESRKDRDEEDGSSQDILEEEVTPPIQMTLEGKVVNPNQDSITNVYSLFDGVRGVVSIRMNKALYSRFKPVARRYFGSVCRAVESYMAGVLTIANSGVNFGNTVKIEGGLHIERNIRPRRKLVVEEKIERKKTIVEEKPVVGIDYSSLSVEELLSLLKVYRDEYPQGMLIRSELRRRGFARNGSR